MKKTYFWILLLFLSVFFDGWSTYLVTGGNIHAGNELHYIAQVFNGSFGSLVWLLLVEFVLLSMFYWYSQKMPNGPVLEEKTYRVLSHRSGTKMYAIANIKIALKKVAPFVIGVFSMTHLAAAFNNVMVYIYNNHHGKKGVLERASTSYVEFLYLGSRLYLFYVFVLFASLALASALIIKARWNGSSSTGKSSTKK
ncbi:hypothetical protein [Sphingobacterium psychroaquaticum]|uniref:Uncharacterized protein n=1 Tax=Sphingobacterium psychroaquaticum TaxID=561061 RepID=A0A1X7KYU3_9SPHI|nr:hypothetical protein [Sphingobacterium psychroaquaticum]SMG46343.1 hypothetical protein SAMN05660862_3296 [Sphingobacterium psychroaquaticum]